MEISLYNPEFSLIRHIFLVPTSVGLGRFYCTLCDLQIDEDFSTLGGKKFLIYDSGPALDRIIMFGNKNILSFIKQEYPIVVPKLYV